MAMVRRCDCDLKVTPFLSEILVVSKGTFESPDGWQLDRSSRVASSASRITK